MASSETISFDGLPLDPESYVFGPLPGAVTMTGMFGDELAGEFVAGGVEFSNAYNPMFTSWRGFAYSNTTDATTPGLTNESSAITGSGRSTGDDNYAVGFGYLDRFSNPTQPTPFDPLDGDQLLDLATIDLPFGRTVDSVWVTNTTYAVLSMEAGDSFAKAFGGPSGADPDWFKLTAYGTDDAGVPLGVAVDFYLADFRFTDPAADYIVRDWTAWDLSALAGARRLHFNLASSDVGTFGMNTPAYFALDDLTLDLAIEPGDYNADGEIDAADYTVWRDADGSTVDRRGAGPDGDLSGAIDAADYAVWRDAFPTSGSAAVVPEPSARFLIGAAFFVAPLRSATTLS